MNIAITGASGLIGRETAKELKRNDFNVILLSHRKDTNDTYFVTDYSVENLTDIFNFNNIDVVIHLAARRGGSSTHYSIYQVNETLTDNILQGMVKSNRCKYIVYMSSISIYSDINQLPWKEDVIPSPNNYYGLSKLTCEYLCKIYQKYKINYTIFRCAHVLGIEKTEYMLSKFIFNAFNKKKLYVRGQSIAKREFIYVKDVAHAILWTLVTDDAKNQTFNLGYGDGYTNFQVASMINTAFSNEGNLEYISTEDEGIISSYMDTNKIFNAGFIPKFTIEEALSDIYCDLLHNEVSK